MLSMEILVLARFNRSVQSKDVNCDPWTPFCLSSGDAGLVDLFLSTHDDREDLAGNVAFQGANGVEFGVTFGDTPDHIVLGLRIRPETADCDVCRALLAARSPPRFRR